MSHFIHNRDMPKFTLAYKKAKGLGHEKFLWRGKEVLVSYAKYVVQYYEQHKEEIGK